MKENHMGPQEVPQSMQDLGAKRMMAIHFGTFSLGDDQQQEPGELLKKIAQSASKTQQYIVPKVGETLKL